MSKISMGMRGRALMNALSNLSSPLVLEEAAKEVRWRLKSGVLTQPKADQLFSRLALLGHDPDSGLPELNEAVAVPRLDRFSVLMKCKQCHELVRTTADLSEEEARQTIRRMLRGDANAFHGDHEPLHVYCLGLLEPISMQRG